MSIPDWNFDNTYARLPEVLFARLDPVPVRAPALVVLNRPLAETLGLDPEYLSGEYGINVFSGNLVPDGAEPIAQAYAGHQFGHFTLLGDGRAIVLGEQVAPDGQRFDIQLKGSGRTPFSRRGDGRAALGPMLREHIMGEAMHALGIPTTRSLAVTTTGEPVFRETPLPGAVLTRVAASHIRVGTFELLAARGLVNELRTLAAYTLSRHFPERADEANPALALLNASMERQAHLVAKWMLVGFVHGVMNTDNMVLGGETIDYGPCAFIDDYDPAAVFSSIDREGRYAFGNQPTMAHWNLARLAEALLPILHEDENRALELAMEALAAFPGLFHGFWLDGMRKKLGLFTAENEDPALIDNLLALLLAGRADYANSFRDLARDPLPHEPLFRHPNFQDWHECWTVRRSRQSASLEDSRRLMLASNPSVIPRNHRVEEALAAAVGRGDYSALDRLLKVLARPFDDTPEHSVFRNPPSPDASPYVTYCGT